MNAALWLSGSAGLPLRIVAGVTVVWLLAGLAALLLGRLSAALRHRLWSLTMLAAVVTPAAVLLLPEFRLGWIAKHEIVAAHVASQAPGPEQENPASPELTFNPSPPAVIAPAPSFSNAVESTSPRPANPSTPVEASSGEPIGGASSPAVKPGYLWLVVFVAPMLWQLIRIVRALALTRGLVRRAQPITDARVTKQLALWGERLGWRRKVPLLESAETNVPLCAGLWRPTVILPADWQDWSGDALSAALGHELAHAARRDVAWQLIARVACAIYWFHPLGYLAAWRMRVEREAACDDVVLAAGQQPAAYARVLLDLASRLSVERTPDLALPMAARTGLEQRVRAILAGSRARSPVSRAAGLLLLAATFTAVLAAGSLSPLAPEITTAAAAASEEQPATPKTVRDAAPKKENEFVRVSRIAGRASDPDGSPIRGATVLVVADNRVLAEALTSNEGKYELIDVQVPVSTVKYPWGTTTHADFSVVAMAKGFGLAWREPIAVRTDWMRNDRADELSGELPGQAKQVVIEPDIGTTLDLSFRPASLIRGRVVDENGKPIAGVTVRPLYFIQYSTDKKAEAGKTDAFVLSGFSDRRVSQPLITDEHGSFAVANLPKEVGVWLAVKQPGFADADVGITNSDRLSQDYANSVIKVSASSEALITLRSTHPVVIKVTDSQTGLPVAGLAIQTNEWFADPEERGKGARSHAQGTTDDQGRVKFQLPKGKHFLFVVTEVNAPYIFRNQIVDVTGEAAEQVFTMPIRRHSQVTVRIVDAQRKKGIPGVPIWISRSKTFDGNTDLYSIFSHRPVSDAAGEIKGFLSDGQVQIGLGALRTHRLILPEGYEADAADKRTGREFELKDGKDLMVEFALQKKAAGEKNDQPANSKAGNDSTSTKETKEEDKDTVEVQGDVLDEAGKPAPNITVTHVTHPTTQQATRSGVDGTFSFRIRRSLLRQLMLVARSDDGLRQGFVVHAGESQPRPPRERIVLGKSREISVTVVDAEKRPVAEALVAATSWFSKIADVKSDKNGKAVLLVPAEMPLQYVYALKADVGLDYFMYRGKDQPVSDPHRLAPNHSEPLTLTLAGVRVVRVRVVDEKKQPLAGVSVNPWYVELPNKGGDFNTVWALEVTDRDGVAEFHTIPANNKKPITFWSQKERYFSLERTYFDPTSAASEVTSQLLPQVRVHGTVKLADGKPAGGAVVAINGDGLGRLNDYFHGEARCNAAGEFEKFVNSDEFYLFVASLDRQISKAELRVVLADKETPPVELALAPATRVFGTLYNPKDSKPLGGEYLVMSLLVDGDEYFNVPVDQRLPNKEGSNKRRIAPRMSYNTITDDKGRFEFFGGRGQYNITATNLREKAPKFKLDGEKDHELRLEVDLPPDVDLSGKVVLASDATKVVAEANVTAIPLPVDIKSGLRGKNFSAVSSAAGTFNIRRSPVEMLVTARSADGLLGAMVTLGADAKEMEIPLVPTASAHGRLIDADTAKPLAGQRIEYVMEMKFPGGVSYHFIGNFAGSATSDDRGEFILTGLLIGGDYKFSLVGPADRAKRERAGLRSLKVERAEVIELGDVKGKAIN